MASFTEQQVKERLKEPKNKAAIQRAIQQHDRLKMHVTPNMDASSAGVAFSNFLKEVEARYPKDKFTRFKQYIRFPLPSVDINDYIFKTLKRVFDGEDKYIKHEFVDAAYAADFEQFKNEVVYHWDFMSFDYWEAIKTSISSFAVIDLPEEQLSEYPEPYVYIVDINDVIDVDLDDANEVHFIAFWNAAGEIVAIDDYTYKVFEFNPRNRKDPYIFKFEKEHDLAYPDGTPYAPAHPLWKNARDKRIDNIEKKGPITNLLGKFDDYVEDYFSGRYFKSFGKWPVMWKDEVEAGCGVEFERDGKPVACEDGFIKWFDDLGDYNCDPCPKCSVKNSFIGPGTEIEIPKKDIDEKGATGDPVGMLKVDKTALDFNEEDLRNAEDYITKKAVGSSGEMLNGQAINAKQTAGIFESKYDVISSIRDNVQEFHKWMLDTMARLRYGTLYVRTTLTYGDQYYLETEEEVSAELEASQKPGIPSYMRAAARKKFLDTKYRNNEDMRLRGQILEELEPYSDMSTNEFIEMAVKAAAIGVTFDRAEIELKSNFSNYVHRFERENLPVEQFGINIDFDKKIEIIKEALYSYINLNLNSDVKGRTNSGITGTAGFGRTADNVSESE